MGSRSPMRRGNFDRGRGGPLYVKCRDLYIETAEPIKVPFGVGPRKHVLDGR